MGSRLQWLLQGLAPVVPPKGCCAGAPAGPGPFPSKFLTRLLGEAIGDTGGAGSLARFSQGSRGHLPGHLARRIQGTKEKGIILMVQNSLMELTATGCG